jgi:beta-glucosidase
MTDDERLSLLISVMGANIVNPVRDKRIPQGVLMSAGDIPRVPRLGIPALLMTDASLGVTNPGYRPGDHRHGAACGLGCGRALQSDAGARSRRNAWTRSAAPGIKGTSRRRHQSRARPRNGRNFECRSEDPWHSLSSRLRRSG